MLAFIPWAFALSNLKRDLGLLWGWVCHRSFWQLMFGAALILAGFEYIGKRAEQRHNIKVEAQLSKVIAAREADRRAYVKGQADSAAQNKAHAAKIERHYQRNSDNERQSYLDDLARLRGMRRQDPAPQGAAGAAGLSAPSAATPRINEAGLCVPATSDVCEAGAEIELRLMHLQNLTNQQTQVDPNAP